ncbi:SUMF1/EgtB/PvdO family nonheme iron enzyme, partial [Escherichia coli]|uniref:SUMF1/EgtB/PvdO family nonheme iron enzyme n=1 Tax=Escherichia coli TaxID=562 RepID=UPI001EDB2481
EYVGAHPAWKASDFSTTAPENTWIDVASGQVKLGINQAHPFYGWDNEFGQHEAQVEAFQASKYLVSNQEFLAFVDADGYSSLDYWEQEG